jgi:hypothetical protein
MSEDRKNGSSIKECCECSETILESAKVCNFCGASQEFIEEKAA